MPPRSRSHDPTGRPTTPDPINPEAGESESTPKARRRADPQTTPKPRTTAKQRSRSSARTTEDTTADDPSSSPPLLPFSRYDEALPSTLGQLLHMELPPPPLFSDPEVAKTPAETKSMSGAELQVPEDKVLAWIIYAPDLLNNLVAYTKRRIRELKINFSDRLDHDFAVAVLPWHSSVGLTPVVFTEKDVEDWVYRVLLAPALLIVLALRDQGLPVLHRGLDSVPPLDAQERGPYISSAAPRIKSIPDAIVVDVKQQLKGVAEVKPENALLGSPEGTFIFQNILRTDTDEKGKSYPGRPIKFNWPGVAGTTTAADKQTRMICQIFTQLVERQCDFGMLSSYVQSGFHYREGQCLYMSSWHQYTDGVLLEVVAWMALALGVPGFERDMLIKPVPERNFRWDENMLHKYDVSGVVRETLPRSFNIMPVEPSQPAPSIQPSAPTRRVSTREKKPVFPYGGK